MKKFAKIALLLLLVLASVFIMVACDDEGDGEVVASGTITVKEAPQVMFVQGEELDLSNGVLEVKNGDTVTEVALNAEGVTVTGYDKNVLGTQTVTISYQGCTTQLAVTVVARMVAEDAVTDYLVGDTFDVSKGRVRITRNDGTTFTAIFNSDKVTVTGFDSSKTGEQTLTVTYKNGDVNYTCQFPVTVYAVDSVNLTEPTKTKYNSHDAAMNLKGGSLTLKGKNGALVREIPLTDDTVSVSGFDPSIVTEAKPTSKQIITVTYREVTEEFEITLTYTDVSSFKDNAGAYVELDWSDPELSFSKELGATALELMELYMDFSPAEQAYITEDERVCVARAAFLYGLTVLRAEEAALQKAFAINSQGLYLTCESRTDVQSAIIRLQKQDNVLYTVSPVLIAMQETFPNDVLTNDTYFKDAVLVPVEYYELLIGVFQHMIDVSDASNEIPADWKTQGIANYSTQIEGLFALINANLQDMANWIEIYYYVSSWRAADDMFDIMYEHYLAQENMDALSTLASIRYPTGLETVISYITSMMEQQEYFNQSYTYDGIWVLYYYHHAAKAANEIKNGSDEVLKKLYDLFDIDAQLEEQRVSENGYYAFCGGLLGDPDFDAFLNDYIALLDAIANDDENGTYQKSEQYGEDIQNLLDAYVALSPTQQLNLLTIFNAFYGQDEPYPQFAFDAIANFEYEGETYELDLTSTFVGLLNGYYEAKLTTDAGKAAYLDLMIAMEIYAQRGANAESWYTDFTTRLGRVGSAYESLVGADKTFFEQHLLAAYNQYVDYLAVYDAGTAITTPEQLQAALGEWEDEFLALQDAVSTMWGAYIYHLSYDKPMYTMFLMGYERAAAIYNKILSEAPDEIIDILYHYDIYGKIGLTEGFAEATGNSFEYFMGICRTVYINYLQTAVGGSIYDMYMAENGLHVFMNMAYDILDENLTEETMLTIMKAYREMSIENQMMIISLDGDTAPYMNAIVSFVLAIESDSTTENPIFINYTQAAAETIDILLYVEQYTILYRYYESIGMPAEYLTQIAEYIGKFVNGAEAATEEEEDFAGLVAMYEALAANPEDKESFEPFEEMYAYYMEICEDIIATIPAEE